MSKPTGSRPKPSLPPLEGRKPKPQMNKTRPGIKHTPMGRKSGKRY